MTLGQTPGDDPAIDGGDGARGVVTVGSAEFEGLRLEWKRYLDLVADPRDMDPVQVLRSTGALLRCVGQLIDSADAD